MPTINIEDYRRRGGVANPLEQAAKSAVDRSPKNGKGLFIHKQPLLWAMKASKLGPRASAAGILLWFLAGVQKKLDGIYIEQRHCELVDLSRDTLGKGLRSLAESSLIKLHRHEKRRYLIDIVEWEEKAAR